jgi:hypothetical protein
MLVLLAWFWFLDALAALENETLLALFGLGFGGRSYRWDAQEEVA